MNVVGEDDYELPLFESDLHHLTFSSGESTETSEGQDEDMESGTLHVKETVADSGNGSISVVHRCDGERIDRFRFNIIDFDQRICRYTGSDNPPWAVYCAVTQYGYYCQTAPQSGRKYAFDLLAAGALEIMEKTIDQEYEYLTGWGLRVFERLHTFIQLMALEYQIGPENMNEAISTLNESGDDGESTLTFENLDGILKKYDIENAFIPHSRRHPSTTSFIDDCAKADSTRQYNNESKSNSDDPVWVINKHRGRGDHENIIYVSIIGSDGIDRFQFQITNEVAGKCVAQTNVVGDVPPYSVIESVQDEFDITNIPSFTFSQEGVSYCQLILDVDKVLHQTAERTPPESDFTNKILDEYISNLEICLSIIAAYEKSPEEYNRGVNEAFSKLDIELSVKNIGKLSREHLDQITFVAMQSVNDVDEVKKLSRELLKTTNVEKRRRVNITEDPDVSLAKRLYNKDMSMYE